MEHEIKNRVARLSERAKVIMENETATSRSLDEDDVKRYLHEILVEIEIKEE
jgi:hypothetical protein